MINPDTLPRIQRKVFFYLLAMRKENKKRSAAEISAALFLSDPRGHIAELRNKGFNIADEWVTSMYGNRCKVYWLVDSFETNHPAQ